MIGDYQILRGQLGDEAWVYGNIIIDFSKGEVSVCYVLGNEIVATVKLPNPVLKVFIYNQKQKDNFAILHSNSEGIKNIKSVSVLEPGRILIEEKDGNKEEIDLEKMYEVFDRDPSKLYALVKNGKGFNLTDAMVNRERLETFILSEPNHFIQHFNRNNMNKPEIINGKTNIEKALSLFKRLGPGQVQLFNMQGEKISFNLIENQIKDSDVLTILFWKDGSRSLVYKTDNKAMATLNQLIQPSKTGPGGIDLNPAQMNMQVKNGSLINLSGKDNNFDFKGTEINAAQVIGVTFNIRSMTPAINIPVILGLEQPTLKLNKVLLAKV
jgi:hypothetical protein